MEQIMRKLEIGSVVTFIDALYKAHDALVTAIWGEPHGALQKVKLDESGETVLDSRGYSVLEEVPDTRGKHWPCINLVFVADDEAKQDQYGRQIERNTSVVHISHNSAGGMCWQWPDESHEVTVTPIT